MIAPRLMILSDAANVASSQHSEERWFREILPVVLAKAQRGSVLVQLRHKRASARDRLHWARYLRELTSEHGQWFVVNDRLDIARIASADGVHLPADGVSVAEARACFGPRAWVSVAWHGEPLLSAEAPDAWVLSPVMAPRKGRPRLGAGGLREALCRTSLGATVYALGGITAHNAPACLAAGASGVAVVGAAATLEGSLDLLSVLGVVRPESGDSCAVPGRGRR